MKQLTIMRWWASLEDEIDTVPLLGCESYDSGGGIEGTIVLPNKMSRVLNAVQTAVEEVLSLDLNDLCTI